MEKVMIMIETLDYTQVPSNFMHCFRAECPHANECLRYQATRFIPSECKSVVCLNPLRVPNPTECPEFLSDKPVQYAYGISRLYDDIPFSTAKDVKDDVITKIGKSQYYRMKKELIGISPRLQQSIKAVFQKHGIDKEPLFDRHEFVFQWNKKG